MDDERRQAHKCHARGCIAHVKPELLMCAAHWRTVPYSLQRAVYGAYRPGQCNDMRPSAAWHEAADAAIGFVALREGRDCTRGEIRALVRFGYENWIVGAWGRKGARYKRACEKVIAEIKGEGR